MSGILDKYDESIKLTYNYTYRMLVHLKNITDNFKKLERPDEITIEVYRDSIIKKHEKLEDLTWKLLSKVFKASGLEINNPRGCYKQAFREGLINDIIGVYSCDIVFLDSLNEDIEKQIARDGVEIYCKN